MGPEEFEPFDGLKSLRGPRACSPHALPELAGESPAALDREDRCEGREAEGRAPPAVTAAAAAAAPRGVPAGEPV
jgi:hypothetical protein